MKKISDGFNNVKGFIVEMPKKRKIIFGVVAGAIVALAITLTILLNSSSGGYIPIYKEMDSVESAEVFSVLKTMGADAQINNQGEVVVPAGEYDVWLLQLAAEGYPKTTTTYDSILTSSTGLNATDSQYQRMLIVDLQNSAQTTLKKITGVRDAVVSISLPESSNYIWEEANNDSVGTIGVLLTLDTGVELEPIQVTAIKNLLAAGVPDMLPENVKVIDAATSTELTTDESSSSSITIEQNLELERTIQAQIEENIVRLLEPRYGTEGVVATAKATINYDKMLTEQMQLQNDPETDEGFVTHTDGEYNTSTESTIGGIVGEEDNTDIPDYSYLNPTEDDNTTYYTWNTDIDYSYIKTQVESGNAELERATVSVMVNDENLTQAAREELIGLVSKSVDIPIEDIYVSTFTVDAPPTVDPTDVEAEEPWWLTLPIYIYLAVAGGLLIIIVLIVVIILRKRSKKQKEELALLLTNEKEAEIEEYKRKLAEMAKVEGQDKSDAIVEEVRDFAKSNPQITASLLRNWLKEGE